MVGDKEAQDGTVSVRKRGIEESTVMARDAFAAQALLEDKKKIIF